MLPKSLPPLLNEEIVEPVCDSSFPSSMATFDHLTGVRHRDKIDYRAESALEEALNALFFDKDQIDTDQVAHYLSHALKHVTLSSLASLVFILFFKFFYQFHFSERDFVGADDCCFSLLAGERPSEECHRLSTHRSSSRSPQFQGYPSHRFGQHSAQVCSMNCNFFQNFVYFLILYQQSWIT
jgi:hypothetical protein